VAVCGQLAGSGKVRLWVDYLFACRAEAVAVAGVWDPVRPQAAVQRAGKPAVGTAALLRNLTDELSAQFGHCCRWD
jgi:hypothetical protein